MLWSQHNWHCLQPHLLWLLHAHRFSRGRDFHIKVILRVLGGWFIFAYHAPGLDSPAWNNLGILDSQSYRTASVLSTRMNRHLEMEGRGQRSTLTQWTCADIVLAYSPSFSNKKHSKNPICTLEMLEF